MMLRSEGKETLHSHLLLLVTIQKCAGTAAYYRNLLIVDSSESTAGDVYVFNIQYLQSSSRPTPSTEAM